jgi:hypothetical protein
VSEIDFSNIPTKKSEMESIVCLIAENGLPDEAAVLTAHRFGVPAHEMLEYVFGARAVPESLYMATHILYLTECRRRRLNPKTGERIPSNFLEEISTLEVARVIFFSLATLACIAVLF